MRQNPLDPQILHLHERKPRDGFDEKNVRYAISLECFGNKPASGHFLGRNGLLQIP